MPGVTDAITAFLEFVNKSGIPQKIKDVFDKRRKEEENLRNNVAGMKDAPPPNTGGPNG